MKRGIVLLVAAVGFIAGAFAENVYMSCALGSSVTNLVLGAPVSYPCTVGADQGVKTFRITGLPKGLKYDRKTGNIVGTPNRGGTFDITVAVTTKARSKATWVHGTVTVPEFASTMVGAFKGPLKISSDGEWSILSMKIARSGKVTGKLTSFLTRRSLLIKSSRFTSATDLQLTFRNGSALPLRFSTATCGGHPYGVFTHADPAASKSYVPQDFFSLAATRPLMRKLIGGKRVLRQVNEDSDLVFTLRPNGSGTVRGVIGDQQFNCKILLRVDEDDGDGYTWLTAHFPDQNPRILRFWSFAFDGDGNQVE